MSLSRFLPAIRRIGCTSIYWTGIYSIYRRWYARDKITLVFYHDIVETSPVPELPLFVEKRYFWEQVRRLEKDYSIIGMADVLSGNSLPPCSLVITFDGYSRKFLEVARELSRSRIRALFYLLTQPILTGRPHWHQQLFFACRDLRAPPFTIDLNGESFTGAWPGDAGGNLHVARLLLERIERLEEKHGIVQQIADRYSVKLGEFNDTNGPLTPEEVGKMSSLPGIEIGSHSHTHPRYMDADKASHELRTSRELLEKWTQRPVVHYAYPEGKRNPVVMDLLPKMGYLTAAVTGERPHELHSSAEWPYLIPRFGVSNTPFSVLAGTLTGWERGLDAVIRLKRKWMGQGTES